MSATLKYPVRFVGGIALATLLSACGGGNSDGAQGGSLANPEPPTTGDWQLVWEDSFDGDTLDASSWEIQTGNGAAEGIPGWGNNELQYYQADNISVADGVLKIEARADNSNPGFDYTSGRLRTQGKVDFTFGRVEARIKVPSGQGLWSAFWLLGSDPSVYGGWAAKGEIDILEKYLPGFFSSAIHYGGAFPQNEQVSEEFDEFDVADEFHTYAVEWDSEFIRFFVDGTNFYTVTSDTYYNYYYKSRAEGYVEGGPSAPFDEDHHIILNLAVGGNLPGAPQDASVFPATMEVDYVRVYECSIDPATGKGCRDSIDPVNDYISFDVPADAPVVSSSTLYKDGVAKLFPGTNVERTLGTAVYDNGGVFTATEKVDDSGSTVIEVVTSGGGNVSLTDTTGATFNLVNMGSVDYPLSTADFKFDIKVDTEATDSTGVLQVKFDSGFPDVAIAEVSMEHLAATSEWQQVSVPVSDILIGGLGAYGGGPADVSALVNLITFEPTKAASFMLNNIRLDCGATDFCGIQAIATTPLAVFDGGVSTEFDRGIVGYDTSLGTNYSDAQGNHVSWAVVDSGDPDVGTVIETTFSASGASGVTFVGSTQAIDLTPWAAGEVAFDVKVISNPNNFPMVFKLDGVDPGANTTGDQSIGVLPVGEWVTVRVPLSTLAASNYDLSDFAAFVLFPTFAGQDVVFQWGNIRIEPTVSVVPATITVPIDFEEAAISYRFANFEGGAATIVANPELAVQNSSDNVLQFQKFAGATFAGSVLLLDQPVDFSQGEVFRMAVWSSRATSLTFKLEGLNIERVLPLSGQGWEMVEADFTGATGAVDVTGLTFILDNGTAGDAAGAPADWTYYVDNITLQDGPSIPGQISYSNFENANPALGTIGGGWKIFANVFNAGGDYLYGYGPFDAPNNTGGFSGIAGNTVGADQGEYALSVFSDYNNADAHNAGDSVQSSTFLEYTVLESDSGVMTFTFDARLPTENALTAPSQAIAYIQVLDPANGYSVTAREEIVLADLTADQWGAYTLALTVDGASIAGQIVQYGFTSIATGFAPSAVLYDNIDLRLAEPEVVPEDATFVFAADFEASDASAGTIGDAWLMFVNVFSAGGDYLYGYGPFDAPNGTGNVSSVSAGEAGVEQGSQYLNVFSDYANADHGNGNTLDVAVFREFVIAETDSGTYRFSFDAKRPADGGLADPSTAAGFIKILDPNNGYNTVFFETASTSAVSTAEWQSLSIDFTIDGAAQAGLIIQFGFNNQATNYDPSGVYYDNVSVAEYTPPAMATFEFATDFEEADASGSVVGDGWLMFVNVFNAGGDYLYGYGPFDAPNGTGNVSSVATGEAGIDQGVQYLNVFSDYANADHGNGNTLDTSVFKEFVIAEADSGSYRFSFDAKRPADGGLADPSTASGFIKILDPNNGYNTVFFETVSTSAVSTAEWQSLSIDFTIDGVAQAGLIIQFGFNNQATNYDASGVYYDNVSVAEYTPPPPAEASFVFSQDFEAFDVTASEIAGWAHYVNAFTPTGDYIGGGGGAAPNGGNISNVTSGAAGADQGIQYLNVFSNYGDNANHEAGNILETSVYREFVIAETDAGSYRFTFDARRPAADAVAAPASAAAFIKILDPNNGYATVVNETVDMTVISDADWATYTIDITVDASRAGQIIQFGFNNRATNYQSSAVLYDNISVGGI